MVKDEKLVKDIMSSIEEYEMIDAEAPLCDVIFKLKQNHEKVVAKVPGKFHKTMFVTDPSGKIIGKLSFYDMVRGLVPEPAKRVELSKSFYSMVSSRALEVADEVGDMQRRFKWLHTSFADLVKQETTKKAKEVMSPIHPLLLENDTINKAIYIMFKENIRQPLVARDEKIVGVVSLMDILPELMRVAGDECLFPRPKDA